MTELVFLCQVSTEWLISQLEIMSEVYWNIFLDIQDILQNARYNSEVKLNTNEVRTWVECDILSWIRQTWLTVFSHLSDFSARKCLWFMSLHVQTQVCCSWMFQSLSMVRMPAQNTSMSTTFISSSTHISIVFADLMIALLVMNEKTVIKIRIQDLCSDSNLILENILYSLLIWIASEDLDFESQSQKIIFIDTDNISYIIQNDRNLKTAFQSILQSTQQHQQVRKLHIQERSSR